MIKKQSITVIILLFLSLLIFSCKKDVSQSEIDNSLIETYVFEHQLDGEFTSNGLYYVISQPGSVEHPVLNSEVSVSYVGYTLDDIVFEESDDPIRYRLFNFILGWQEGLQLIGEGGKIKLIIPSALAYGSNGSGSIGSNEVLVFDITLHYFLD